MSDLRTGNVVILVGASTLLLMVILFPPVTAQAASDPRHFLDRFGQEATALLSDPGLSQGEREQGFAALLGRFFDVPRIGRFVLGKHWRRTSDPEQLEYRQLFERFLVSVYGRRLSAHPDMGFTIGHARVLEKTVLVDSVISRSRGEPIAVTWRLRSDPPGWRIIDVIVEGISMAITQRSEFDSLIRNNNGSIRALLDKMREAVAANRFDDSVAANGAACCVQIEDQECALQNCRLSVQLR